MNQNNRRNRYIARQQQPKAKTFVPESSIRDEPRVIVFSLCVVPELRNLRLFQPHGPCRFSPTKKFLLMSD
jgi:hypothetical protein